jgi:sulfur-oxidizing protein SoxY
MNTRRMLHRRNVLVATAALGFARAAKAQTQQPDSWPALSAQVFEGRQIADGSAVLAIDAPYRAIDAAAVPVTIQTLLPPDDARFVRRITLTIDENPSPVAAVLSLGTGSGVRTLATRLRVDSYTNLHAVAELSDGQLFGVARFVKASGGCSAPSAETSASSIPFGAMRLVQLPQAAGNAAPVRDAQLSIHHPNYTGMQMDQLTRLYVPAHFITSVRVWQGDQALLSIDCGISIAENPEFRFDYRPNGAATIRAEVADNEGQAFKDQWSVTPA